MQTRTFIGALGMTILILLAGVARVDVLMKVMGAF